MSYQIDTERRAGYLMVVASGKQTFEDNLKMIPFIIETCEQFGVDKVVVDIRGFQGQPGTASDYDLANFTVGEALGKIKRAAVIQREDAYAFASFFETATRNRGINLYAFTDEAEAIAWILQEA